MEMMIQACLPTDGVKATPTSPTTDKGFKELLEFVQESLAEDLPETEDDMDALLMELLNLLNIPINFQDTVLRESLPENLEMRLIDAFQGSELRDQGDKALLSMLHDLFTGFKDTGHINSGEAAEFYRALLAEIPEIDQIDIDTLNAGLKELFSTQSNDAIEGKPLDPEEDSEILNIKSKAKNSKRGDKTTFTIEEEKPLRIASSSNRSKADLTAENSFKVVSKIDVESSYGSPILTEDVSIIGQDMSITPADVSEISHDFAAPELNDKSAIFDQIVDKMKFLVVGGNKQINIRLKPEYLGQVLVKVFTEKNRMRAEFFVGNTQVKELLSIHAQDFKNEVQEQGLNFADISVYDMSDSLNNGSFNQFQGESNNNPFKKAKYVLKGGKGNLDEVSAEGYYDPWQHMSNVDFKA